MILNIKSFRSKLGLTQEEFAHELGVALTTVNRWENSTPRKPSKLAILALKAISLKRNIPLEYR